MDKIEQDFNNLIGELTNDEFKEYIFNWIDEQIFLDIMNNWDSDTKKDAIKELKEIIKNRN